MMECHQILELMSDLKLAGMRPERVVPFYVPIPVPVPAPIDTLRQSQPLLETRPSSIMDPAAA